MVYRDLQYDGCECPPRPDCLASTSAAANFSARALAVLGLVLLATTADAQAALPVCDAACQSSQASALASFHAALLGPGQNSSLFAAANEFYQLASTSSDMPIHCQLPGTHPKSPHIQPTWKWSSIAWCKLSAVKATSIPVWLQLCTQSQGPFAGVVCCTALGYVFNHLANGAYVTLPCSPVYSVTALYHSNLGLSGTLMDDAQDWSALSSITYIIMSGGAHIDAADRFACRCTGYQECQSCSHQRRH